jgi:UDP-GlcNAc:undecaprenyl-phosphate GlcNAc-1-phosphate transferase
VSELLVQHLTALLLGFGVTSLLIPRIIAFAHKNAVLDFPNDRRRVHRVPVPRLGGVAIFVGTAVGSGAVLVWSALRGTLSLAVPALLPGVIIGATLVFFVGLVDDLRGVYPRGKLIAQSLAAAAVIAFGFSIDTVALSTSGTAFSLGIFAIPVTIAWIVGMTNAFNLIDGADGLAGTFALIGLVTAVGVDLYLHDVRSLAITVALLGAVFAFLRYNHSPARIFLGDSGSMVIGFFLAIRLVIASTTTDGRTIVLVPLFALAFPLVDTGIAIARRWLAGHPFSRADGRHIHHQVLALGIPTRLTVDLLGLFFLGVAALGLSISFAPPRFTLAFLVVTAIFMFAAFVYGTRWLRYGEFAELAKSVRSVVRFARTVVREKIRTNEVAAQIGAAKSFEEVRALLDELVDDVRVLDVELVAGDVRTHGPERQQISPPDQLPIRLDYPFVWHSEAGSREVVLRLWSERPRHGVHPSTERVATRIGPVLEDWFRRHSQELTPVFGVEAQAMYRKTPSPFRRSEG